MAWGWTGLRFQPGPNKSPVKSRPFRAQGAQTWPWSMLTGLIPSSVRQTRAVDGDRSLTGTSPRGLYSDSYARKRAHDSTTSHLTPDHTPARRHEGTADQMACQFASLEHDKRGAATADGFAIFVPAHHPSHLFIDELTTRVSSKLSGRLFSIQCAVILRHRLGSR
jgi:hypothetical protein